MVEQERDREDRRGRVGLLLAGDVGGGSVHRLEHARERARAVDVARRGEADAARDRGRQVGDDVAEQVVGDDDVEAGRVGDQEDHGRVDVQVVDGDVRVLGGDAVDGALPEGSGEGQHVGLVHERDALALALRGQVEREPHGALDAVRRVHGHLGRDLVLGAAAEDAAVARVRSLGALADDDEVDLAGRRERGGHTGQQGRRPQVDVVVEREAQLEQQAALDDAAREARVAGVAADRAEEDRVVLREGRQVGVREDLPGLEEVAGAERVLRGVERHVRGHRLPEHAEGLVDDLRADAVPGDDGERDGAGHGSSRDSWYPDRLPVRRGAPALL